MSGPSSIANFPNGFANGMAVRGMPLLQMQPGQVFYCGNGNVFNPGQRGASNTNNGTYLGPYSTLDYALSRCVQGRGDIVFILPGHKESIPDASTLAFDCADVAIVGLGGGASRPTFTFNTAASANIPVRSANMSIQNCLFINNFADIASNFTGIRASSATSTISGTTFTAVGAVTGGFYPGMILRGTGVSQGTMITRQLTGADNGIGTYEVNVSQTVASTTITGTTPNLAIENCEFRDTSAILNALTIVTGNATANSMDGLTFSNNRISSLGTTALTTAIVLASATDRVSIVGNFGNWAVLNDTPAMLQGGANDLTNFMFAGNKLNRPNTSSTGGSFIGSTSTACTGHCYDNYMYQLDASAGIWIPTGTKLAFSQNFSPITGAADKSGLINPAAV